MQQFVSMQYSSAITHPTRPWSYHQSDGLNRQGAVTNFCGLFVALTDNLQTLKGERIQSGLYLSGVAQKQLSQLSKAEYQNFLIIQVLKQACLSLAPINGDSKQGRTKVCKTLLRIKALLSISYKLKFARKEHVFQSALMVEQRKKTLLNIS